MNLLTTIKRALTGDVGEPALLDHVPVSGAPDWRAEKLKAAAERHGKPFRCAADGLPRELQKDGATVVVRPKSELAVAPNVSTIKRRGKPQ